MNESTKSSSLATPLAPATCYEQQLATVESLMTCYDTPLTQAAGYVRDLLRTLDCVGRHLPAFGTFQSYSNGHHFSPSIRENPFLPGREVADIRYSFCLYRAQRKIDGRRPRGVARQKPSMLVCHRSRLPRRYTARNCQRNRI